MVNKKQQGPRVLIFDIETKPVKAWVWGLFDQNVGLNQIIEDWSVISWSAKWLGDSPNKIMYMDQRKAKDLTDDKKLLKKIWELLDEADIVITQNGKRFDVPKLNSRFKDNGFEPPSSYKHIDICEISKQKFGFTSNKLEFLTDKLCKKYKKKKHKKYPGFELWRQTCQFNNQDAWKEMEKYNKYDVLSLEELYTIVIPWVNNTVNFNLYTESLEHVCKCGSLEFKKQGYAYTATGKFQRYKCTMCGAESRDRTNLFSKEKKKALRA